MTGHTSTELLDSEVLWQYLTSHLDLDRIQQWLDSGPGSTWPYSLPFSTHLLSHTSLMTTYYSERLLTLCAKYVLCFRPVLHVKIA